MEKATCNVNAAWGGLLGLIAVLWAAPTSAQACWQWSQECFSNGADFMSVPKAGQPGAEFFSSGADFMSVPKAGQPGAEFFSGGADLTSVPRSPWFAAPAAAGTPTEELQPLQREPTPPPSPAGANEAQTPVQTAPPPLVEAPAAAAAPADTWLPDTRLPSEATAPEARPTAVMDNSREQVGSARAAPAPLSTTDDFAAHAEHPWSSALFHLVTRWARALRVVVAVFAALLAVLVVLARKKVLVGRRRVGHPPTRH
ncbi:MAG TPA: hypothetical protein VF331_13870 [Polyangiales bacterium]